MSEALQKVPAASAPQRLPGARSVLDVTYHQGPDFDDDKHRLDLHLPRAEGPHPVLVFVHGGFWSSGGRRDDFGITAWLGRRLAEKGIVTAVISYRLAPEFGHPDQQRDVARAIAFMLKNCARWGGDPSRVFAAGHSSGAHLVMLAATDPRWLAEQGVESSALAGVIGLSGVYDVEHIAADAMTRETVVEPAFGSEPAAWRAASPLSNVTPGAALPPIFIAVAEDDIPALVVQAGAMARTLRAARAQVVERFVLGRDHLSIMADLAGNGDALGEDVLAFIAHPPRAAEPMPSHRRAAAVRAPSRFRAAHLAA
jgi:acetyl esterase/lipase